jgi:putative endopeptidase
MDEARAEALGLGPLDGELARIEAIKSRASLVEYLSHLQVLGINNPVAIAIQPDAKRPDVYTVYADQAGLGMPDRDYYLSDDAKFATMREKYLAYVATLLKTIGTPGAITDHARAVMALETRLAKAQWPNVDLRNVDKIYNPFDLAGAGKLTPAIDWPTYLELMGIAGHDSVIIGEPSYFKELSAAVRDVPLAVWRNYLRVRVADEIAPYLNAAMVDLAFDFNGRTITGTPEIRPRWKRGLAETEASIGDMLGKAYVARHYPPTAKARMDELVANLRAAFASSIDELEWMGPETRREAHAKLDSFTVKIGYPEKWKEYPGLVIRRDDLVGNVLRAREVNHRREVRKLGQPIDRTEWLMTPQTVNAYYNPLANEIVFPAAILQPPFFDMTADDAVNYGGIGAVIGHEISHGFDDQGRKFDGKGMLRDWWTEEDNGRFQARAGALVSQYSAFSPLPGLNVNGELTLGENIGDLSGVAVAYKAYRIALGGATPPVIDGFTGDQRFFLGFGQIWARKYRDDELRKRLLTDPHSPAEYRCNGVVRNMTQFATAFDVKPGDKLYLPPGEQVRIW